MATTNAPLPLYQMITTVQIGANFLGQPQLVPVLNGEYVTPVDLEGTRWMVHIPSETIRFGSDYYFAGYYYQANGVWTVYDLGGEPVLRNRLWVIEGQVPPSTRKLRKLEDRIKMAQDYLNNLLSPDQIPQPETQTEVVEKIVYSIPWRLVVFSGSGMAAMVAILLYGLIGKVF